MPFKLLPIEVAVEFDLDLADDVLFKLDSGLVDRRALGLVILNGVSECLYFPGDEFDLFEDGAVEFLHQKLLMPIVHNRLIRVYAYRVQQLRYVVASLPVQAPQLDVLLEKTLRYSLQFLQLTLNALLLPLQKLVLAAHRLHQIKH